MNILVTGGAGYIGSHTIIELLASGHGVVVVDNLSNSSAESLRRVEEITGQSVPFYEFDLRDRVRLAELFRSETIDAAIHFAGLKAVGESVERALLYYQNNLESTLTLLDVMQEFDVKKLVFSSSATVYGDPARLPITEDMPLSATNPYGQTKLMIEQILRDVAATRQGWQFTSLRYFNPVGAHPSGRIGEDPSGIPNNLLPFVSQVAVGKRDHLSVFGDDYDTPDGTGVRDYIHVVDLARAHVAALEHLGEPDECKVYNIGTGRGTSVLELVKAFETASGKEVPYQITPRRPGDIAACYADPGLAEAELGWRAELTIEDACRDAWNWQSNNPNGYET
ncbi:UDP-glucose 4-epimerase GalE [Candidatus Saccharibacteria bacterium oral taxon 488]|nr:UDP-glucose 4-epimerase GalE [Candidatus Saccharibacteria bacterium oral taxon 488]